MASTTLHDISGAVVEPGDDGYDEARTVWNGMVDRHPRHIVRCADATDVATAIRFSTQHDLEIGVRCGGHGIVGHAVADDGLMIDLRPMGDVQVDAAGRRARVQGGALLGALDRASQRHGLATTAGNVSHTGVGGLTLGGGMGWLARRLGLACDNVLAFELVTAEGELLRVDRDSHHELDWALRGGGGNFGVVTAFEFALHPEPGDTIAVEFHYPIEDVAGSEAAATAMRAWRDLSIDAPRESTFTATISGGTVALGFVWVGDPFDARARIAELEQRLHQAASPASSSVDPLSYLELQTREDDIEGHAWRRYWKGHYFRELDDDLIDALLVRDDELSPDVSLQAYGGAIADVPGDATAFSRRDTAFEFVAASRWRSPDEDTVRMAAARRYASTMDEYSSGAYVNVLGDDGDAGIRRAYSADQLTRLTAVKDAYDPGNVFHLNQNIRPTAD